MRNYDMFETNDIPDIKRYYIEKCGIERAEETMEEEKYLEKVARAYKNLVIEYLKAIERIK